MECVSVEVENVWFSYNGRSVLENISFFIPEKGFTALIGPNGGGKTTLLKLMAGLLNPKQGQIRIFGLPPKKISQKIGYVPQDVDYNKEFPISVFDVVVMGRLKFLNGYGISARDKQTAQKILERIGLWEYRKNRIGELSGGQRQKVFIARALAGDPEILFLDEPTSSVDAASRREFYQLLKDLNKTITIVLASHDLMTMANIVKSVACVNKNLHYHQNAGLSDDTANIYECPMDLISHGMPQRSDSPSR